MLLDFDDLQPLETSVLQVLICIYIILLGQLNSQWAQKSKTEPERDLSMSICNHFNISSLVLSHPSFQSTTSMKFPRYGFFCKDDQGHVIRQEAMVGSGSGPGQSNLYH